MSDVALIRADAVEELKSNLKNAALVIVNKAVVIEGRKWYIGPIVISTMPEDLPKVPWHINIWRRMVYIIKCGFR